jgi:hypothetical protein
MRKTVLCAALLLAAGMPRAQGQDGARSEVDAQRSEPQAESEPPAQQDVQRSEPPVKRSEPQAQQDVRRREAQEPGAQQPLGPTSDAFDRACMDLLQGRMPAEERALRTLKDACGSLMAGRADERLEAERRRREQLAAREQLRLIAEGRAAEPRVQPGQATGPVEPGTGVLAAFGEAASELTGRAPKGAMGMRTRGPVGYTLITNPFGWFTGLGVNAELYGSFEALPKFSWVTGARYSNTDATSGNATTFGGMGGVDWYLLGQHNEGFRIGPRVEVAAGRERFGDNDDSNTFARLGMSGETGYNFIARNGITGLLAVGVGGRVAGDDENEDFASFVGGDVGPYLKAGLGYSW